MSDRVNAAVDRVQQSPARPVGDRPVAEPKVQELPPSDDAVLKRSELRHHRIDSWTPFSMSSIENGVHQGHKVIFDPRDAHVARHA